VQPIWATKNDLERETEETERLVRPRPKKKPPRHDRRREQVNPDQDPDTQADPDLKGDPDTSLNYKDVGGSAAERVAARFRTAEDMIKVRRRDTGKTVFVRKKRLQEDPGKYEEIKPDEDDKKKPPWEGKEPGETAKKPPWKGEGEKPPEKPAEGEKPPEEGEAKPGEEPPEKPEDEPAKDKDEKPAEGEAPKGAEAEVDKLIAEDPSFQKALLSVQEKTNAQVEKSEKILKELEGLEKDDSPEATERKKALIGELNVGQDELQAYADAVQDKVERAQAKQDIADQKKQEAEQEAGEEAAKSEAEKAGVKDPERPEPTEAEQLEAMEMIVDTFPPAIAADIIAKGYHPSDIRKMAASYEEAKAQPIPKGDTKSFAAKAGKIYQIDPSKVKPPKTWTKDGKDVPFEDLDPKEQSEAMREHQMQTVALSLAAKDQLTEALSQRTRSGEPKVPKELAESLSGFMLSAKGKDREKQAKKLAAQTFSTAREKGEAAKIKDSTIENMMGSLPPDAQHIASAFFQANDYHVARQKFLESGEISEHQNPRDIVSGFQDLDAYFEKRSKLYPEGTDHQASRILQSQVRQRLRELNPEKHQQVRAKLDDIEADEYEIAESKWRKARKTWKAKRKQHEQKVKKFEGENILIGLGKKVKGHPGKFKESEPKAPEKPLRYDAARGKKSKIWEDQLRRSGQGKTASNVARRYLSSFYPGALPMDPNSDRTGAYHGVEPYADPIEGYGGWQQAHQRDLGESDYEVILASAQEWLKSPVLSKEIDGYLPDTQLRAALDLSIQSSPYNRAICPEKYNMLLARLANLPPEGFLGETLRSATVLVRTAGHSYIVEKMSVVIYGAGPFNLDVTRAIQKHYFQYRDDEGQVHDDGFVHIDNVNYGKGGGRLQEEQGIFPEGLLQVSFPKGSAAEAFKAIQAVCRKHKLSAEKAKPGYKPTSRQVPGFKPRKKKMPGLAGRRAGAERALTRLDAVAKWVEQDHKKLGMSFDAAKGFVNALDRTADEIEREAFGDEALQRRQVKVLSSVIKRDPDESYMDTFNSPHEPHQTDPDESYMDLYDDDQTEAVVEGVDENGRDLTPNN